MSSEKQIEANRVNSLLAGVKTEEGKQVSRHNSFRHGLTGSSLLSKFKSYEETQEQYLLIVEGLRSCFKPRNFFEESLIAQMAKAQFKQRRFDEVEATCFIEDMNFITRQDCLQFGNVSTLELALKYKNSMDVQYYRALETLIRTRQQLDLFFNEGKSI